MSSNIGKKCESDIGGGAGSIGEEFFNFFGGIQLAVGCHGFIDAVSAEQKDFAGGNVVFDDVVVVVVHDADGDTNLVVADIFELSVGFADSDGVVTGVAEGKSVCAEVDDAEGKGDEATGDHIVAHVVVDASDGHGNIIGEAHGILDDAGDAGHDECPGYAFAGDVAEGEADFVFADGEAIEVVTSDSLSGVVGGVELVTGDFGKCFGEE